MNATQLLVHYERIADSPGAVQTLRRFILDLAVRGQLSMRDPRDESAADLLRRIHSEMSRLGKPKSKKQALPKILSDELPFDIPGSWLWARIREITCDRGQRVPTRDFTYIDVTAIDKESGRITDARVTTPGDAPSRARKTVQRGDVLYSCVRPYLLNVAVVEADISPPPIASTAFAVLNGFGLVIPRYQWIVLRSPFMVECVKEKMRGQAYPAINDADFALLPFPLPPLNEQHRIVAKVDELMVLCDQLEKARTERENRRDKLTAATLARLNAPSPETFRDDARFALDNLQALTTRPDQIKQLRHTILNLAIRGLLAPQDPADGSASELLERTSQHLRSTAVGNARRRHAFDSPNNVPAPFDLPVGWAWATFPSLGVFGRGKSKHRPRNDPSLFVDGTHPLIQTGDVARSRGLISTHSSAYNDAGLAQSAKWPAGTLCITIAANIADSGILAFDACFPDSVVGFTPAAPIEDARYFEYFMRTAKANLLEFAPATAQKNINLEILSQVQIPLPPLAEQRRIVAKVEELMSVCDGLEQALTNGDVARGRLLGSLLAESLTASSEQARTPGREIDDSRMPLRKRAS